MHVLTAMEMTARRIARWILPEKARIRIGTWLVRHRRRTYACKHLRGEGIEIGARELPLSVSPSVRVRYVDCMSRQESLRTFPELDAARVVEPDVIEDGFTLHSMRDETQQFVIASHVLEHSANPLRALESWWRVLRPEGVIFLVVPLHDSSFDRGRVITPVSHMFQDYDAARQNGEQALADRNLPHYVEWIMIVGPNTSGGSPPPTQEAAIMARTLADQRVEIHFHTFSFDSFRGLLEAFGKRPSTPSTLVEIVQLHKEALGVLRKDLTASREKGADDR